MVPLPYRPRARLIILLLRRLMLGALTAFAALTLTFFTLRLIGTDPIDTLLAQGLTSPQQADTLRQTLGLDRPLITQYWQYLKDLAQGDLGSSLYTQRPVLPTIAQQLRWTLELAIAGLVFSIILGFFLGTLAAWWNQKPLGRYAAASASLFTAIPVAFTGILVLWVAGGIGITGSRLLLPAIVLGIATSGPIARLVFTNVAESLEGPYILAARARGIRRGPRLLWHAMRPSLPPIVSLIALEAAFLFSGTVVTETVFSRPGLGRLMVRAILEGDYPITQGLVVIAALIYSTSHVLADWLAFLIDPRLRSEG